MRACGTFARVSAYRYFLPGFHMLAAFNVYLRQVEERACAYAIVDGDVVSTSR